MSSPLYLLEQSVKTFHFAMVCFCCSNETRTKKKCNSPYTVSVAIIWLGNKCFLHKVLHKYFCYEGSKLQKILPLTRFAENSAMLSAL